MPSLQRLRARPTSSRQQPSDADVRRGAAMIREQFRQKLQEARGETKTTAEDSTGTLKSDPTLASTSESSDESARLGRRHAKPTSSNSSTRIAVAKDIMLRNLKKSPSQRKRDEMEARKEDGDEDSVYTVEAAKPKSSLFCHSTACIGSSPSSRPRTSATPAQTSPPPPPEEDDSLFNSLLMESPGSSDPHAVSPLPRSPPEHHRGSDTDDDSLLYDSPWSRRKSIQGGGEASSPRAPTPPPASPRDDDTPVTFMGKNRSLRTKIITYLVEPLDSCTATVGVGPLDEYSDAFSSEAPTSFRARSSVGSPSTVPSVPSRIVEEKKSDQSTESPYADSTFTLRPLSYGTPVEDHDDVAPARSHKKQSHKVPVVISCDTNVPSPISRKCTKLMRADPAYQHAMKAGFLWQSLVGQHIRFPRHWWNGLRSPPMGSPDPETTKWQYIGRYKVQRNRFLNRLVSSRAKPGQLLLHMMVVQDSSNSSHNRTVVQDVVVGCFHPNARGIRQTSCANGAEEKNRDIWLAVRKLSPLDDSSALVDQQLSTEQPWDQSTTKGPLGPHLRVNNDNIRAVYGEGPPLETIFVPESELCERLATRRLSGRGRSPALALLEEFVFA